MKGRLAAFVSGVALFSCGTLASAQQRAMVVHLPEAPIESMSRLADGVTQLAGYLQSAVPNLELEVKAFRKSEDVLAFLDGPSHGAALVVCDAAFLLDLPPDFEVAYRFVRNGRDTRRKLVVVRSDSGIGSLADLRDRSLTVTLSGTPASARFLGEAIFRDEIDPAQWFSRISHETDDFTATAAVLYGRTDAALVSEDNPLVADHVGKDLVQVYASAPVPLSVIALHRGALPPEALAALGAGLESMETKAEAEPILTVLEIDGLRRVEPAARRIADFFGTATARREMEIAVPAMPAGSVGVEPLALVATPFAVGVELREVAIPPELIDSVLKPSVPQEPEGRPGAVRRK